MNCGYFGIYKVPLHPQAFDSSEVSVITILLQSVATRSLKNESDVHERYEEVLRLDEDEQQMSCEFFNVASILEIT